MHFVWIVLLVMLIVPLPQFLLNMAKRRGIKRYQQFLIDMIVGALFGVWSVIWSVSGNNLIFDFIVTLFVFEVSYIFQKVTIRYFKEKNIIAG